MSAYWCLTALFAVSPVLTPRAEATPYGAQIKSQQFNMRNSHCDLGLNPRIQAIAMMSLWSPHTSWISSLGRLPL